MRNLNDKAVVKAITVGFHFVSYSAEVEGNALQVVNTDVTVFQHRTFVRLKE